MQYSTHVRGASCRSGFFTGRSSQINWEAGNREACNLQSRVWHSEGFAINNEAWVNGGLLQLALIVFLCIYLQYKLTVQMSGRPRRVHNSYIASYHKRSSASLWHRGYIALQVLVKFCDAKGGGSGLSITVTPSVVNFFCRCLSSLIEGLLERVVTYWTSKPMKGGTASMQRESFTCVQGRCWEKWGVMNHHLHMIGHSSNPNVKNPLATKWSATPLL